MLKLKINKLFCQFVSSRDLGRKTVGFKTCTSRDYSMESAKRSKNKVLDYALNNEWTHFFTITLDKKKIDRFNSSLVIKKVRYFFQNYIKRYDKSFRYILIPEFHKRVNKDGLKAIHFHGLCFCVNKNYFDFLKRTSDTVIFSHSKVLKSFGRNEFAEIYNGVEFVSYYITKYINKSFGIGQKIAYNRFYSSLRLKTSDVIEIDSKAKERFFSLGLPVSFENRFTQVYRVRFEDLSKIMSFLSEEVKL